MPVSEDAPGSERLKRALEALEARLALLKVPARRVLESEWDELDPAIRALIPGWVKALLTEYAVGGAVLECIGPGGSDVRPFSFFLPADYSVVLADGLLRDLVSQGLFPIASEADGSVWIVRLESGRESEVYLLEHSAWDGGVPTFRNGLAFATGGLWLLLSCMAVSEESSYAPDGEQVLTWYRTR